MIGAQVGQYLMEGRAIGFQEEELAPEALGLVELGFGVILFLDRTDYQKMRTILEGWWCINAKRTLINDMSASSDGFLKGEIPNLE
jgi:hypothetical protein